MAVLVAGKAHKEVVACGWPRVNARTLAVEDVAPVTCADCLRATGHERTHYRIDDEREDDTY